MHDGRVSDQSRLIDLLEFWQRSDVISVIRWFFVSTGYDYAGKPLGSANQDFNIGPLNSTHLFRGIGLDNIVPRPTSLADAWLHLELNATSKSDSKSYSNEQFFHPVPLKKAALRASRVKVESVGQNKFDVRVQGGVAAWVNGASLSHAGVWGILSRSNLSLSVIFLLG